MLYGVYAIAAGPAQSYLDGLFSGGATGWRVFNDPEGSFSVELPGRPERSQQTLSPPGMRPVRMKIWTLERAGKGFYYISAIPFSADGPVLTPDERLSGAKEAALKQAGAIISTERYLDVDGVPGVEFGGTVPGALTRVNILARAFVSGDTAYVALAVHENAGEDAKRVVESFRPR